MTVTINVARSAEEAERLAEHTATCPECAAELRQAQALDQGLAALFVTERGGRPVLALKASARGRVPGIVVQNRKNYAQDLQISIRGFGARSTFGVRGVRLYLDGIPATMPDGS